MPVSPRGELLHTSDVPLFVAAAQGTPHDHLALIASRACIPRSKDCNKQRTILNWLPSPGNLCTEKTETHPSLFMKEAYTFAWSFILRARHLVWHTTRGLLRCTTKTEAGGCHLCTLLLTYSKWLVSLGGNLIYMVPWFLLNTTL